MISVLCITYKRPHLLLEALQSFLEQNREDCEFVIINDNPEVEYVCDIPNVNVVNRATKFLHLTDKIKFGAKICQYDYIFRLDDDDLLTPGALDGIISEMKETPGMDIYKCEHMHFFENNLYKSTVVGINTGIAYEKDFLIKASVKQCSFGEDREVLAACDHDKLHYLKTIGMIYRWGMGEYHVSGMGDISSEKVNSWIDRTSKETPGINVLKPGFQNDYYGQIKNL